MKTGWHGVFPAVTTQFNADLSIDFAATISFFHNHAGCPTARQRWLPHELHNWVNSRKRGGGAHAWQRHHQQ